MSENRIGYLYNGTTFEYQNATELNVDPIEYKVLMPQNCTLLAPPDFNQGEQVPIYNYSRRKWEIIPDYRGVWYEIESGKEVILSTIYDVSQATPNTISEILEKRIPYQFEFNILTLANGKKIVRENPANHYTKLPIELLEWSFHNKCFKPKSDLTDLLARIKEALKLEYKNLIATDIEYKDKVIQADENSISALQQKLIVMDDKSKLAWNTKDNSFIELSKKELINILAMIENRNQIYFMAYQNTKNELNQCETYEQLESLFPQWLRIVNYEPIDLENNPDDLNRFNCLYENIKKLQEKNDSK